jgi:hypothetical protein
MIDLRWHEPRKPPYWVFAAFIVGLLAGGMFSAAYAVLSGLYRWRKIL